jgi:hypothetical protein
LNGGWGAGSVVARLTGRETNRRTALDEEVAMPIILWLLGVPVTLVLVLWFFGIVGF